MKKIVKTLVVALVSCVLAASLAAQESPEKKSEKLPNAVGGFFLSSATFNMVGGLQFQVGQNDFMAGKFGFWGFAAQNSDGADLFTTVPPNFNVSYEQDFVVFKSDFSSDFKTDLFIWILGGYGGRFEESFIQNAILGAGFGVDFTIGEHLSIPFQLGYLAKFPNDSYLTLCYGIGGRFKY